MAYRTTVLGSGWCPALWAIAWLLLTTPTAPAQPKVIKEKLDKLGSANQIEGAIWQYKLSREKGGEVQKKDGFFRIDGKAIFQKKKRVGDVLSEKDETQLVFTDFEELKGGRAFIKRDRDMIWKGYYLDEKRERWKFELRKGED